MCDLLENCPRVSFFYLSSSCLLIIFRSDVQRRRSRSRSKSSLGGSRQTLEKDEDVQSWPLSKFDHMAPFGMICQKGGRVSCLVGFYINFIVFRSF